MAAAGHPVFNISFFSGSVRRIQYTFNSTDENMPSPPPCAVDWPEKAYGGKHNWLIKHCPNVVSEAFRLMA